MRSVEPSQAGAARMADRDGRYALTLIARDAGGNELGQVTQIIRPRRDLGQRALVKISIPSRTKGQGSRYRFNDWSVAGTAFTVTPRTKFGPILWSMYSLSDSRSDEGFVMKISALTGPLGAEDNQRGGIAGPA